jgi:hypothetical protein
MAGIDHESDGKMLELPASRGKYGAEEMIGKPDSFWI